MLQDFNLQTTIDKNYDICIAGTGPAGITLARKLAAAGRSILLLEAGGLEYSDQSQGFYECESVGHDGWPQFTRLRYFGGTSNHWSGRCRPFDRSDFSSPTINRLPGWPIEYSAIEPYLKEAMEIVDLNPATGFRALHRKLMPKDFYADAFAHSPPTRFKAKYLSDIADSENIDCYYNATAVDLLLNQSQSSITQMVLSNYHNQRTSISADRFILCLGGIENPRFLLNCNSQISTGLGNNSDMVGRCFMEHLNVPMGSFIYRDPDQFGKLQFYTSDKFCNARDIGKSNITLSIVKQIRSYGRTKQIKNFFKNIACQMNIEDRVQFISDFKCPGMGSIGTLVEQSPNLDSRVSLSNKVDSMGLNRAKFDWQINDFDKKTIREAAIGIAKGFADAGLGNIRLADFILDQSLDIPFGHHNHHMGTTRMSDSPTYGVVDSNCKVHGIDNLYISGSSVFSTGGACNPTMPIIQLSLRLAQHLNHS